MSYTFDADSGDTRANLSARVVLNSFSETRYAEITNRALNDAVTAICRRVGYPEAYEVQAYDSDGVVTQSTLPWFRVDEVWSAAGPVSAGEADFMGSAQFALHKLDDHTLGTLQVGGGPLYYLVRRAAAPTGFSPQADIRILPPGGGGFVAIKGLQRPVVMDADDDVTGLGAEFDGAVMAYAKAVCFDNEDDFDAAAQWRQRYEVELRQIMEGGVDGDDDSPDTVDGMWGC